MKSFDKIIGYEGVKKELYQVIDMFKNNELYSKIGAKLPKGILIYGKPGMGKTTLAKAFIEECNVNSFVIKKNKNENSTIEEIRDTFAKAANEDSAIILIDDIDKFSDVDDDDVDAAVFVTIQTEMDNVADKNILVIATANNYKRLPESLKRNGRFDVKIFLDNPEPEDARKIIEFYLREKKVNPSLNYENVSKMISYTSCADLETILNESAIYAAFERKETLDIDDIMKAYLKDQFNLTDEILCCDDREIEITALHEAGHAVIAEVLKQGSVGFVSIIPNNKNSPDGFTHLCDTFKRRPENVLISLGGKAAVELFYEGRCASGCQSDIAKAIRLIRDGISDSGTCGLGVIDPSSGKYSGISESLIARNEAVCQAEMEKYLFITRDILIKNKDLLFSMYDKLKNNKKLFYSDIKNIEENIKLVEVPFN